MAQEDVIIVKNVKKQFRIYHDKGNTLKEKILFKDRNSYTLRSVLDDVSFSIKKGEAVGLIGHNGCGKSTTLKLLTRIMYPDSGSIEIKGRVSSLLELGAGFHPDLSGRENIYINASIFGLTKKEIDERITAIIDFSELGDYIDNPVRTYSSGMYMRLAFSVAINVDADVLLIDEILAVGDANFQSKCMRKLRAIKKKGTTIVIVSHSMDQIESICDRSIWLNEGKLVADGKPFAVHRKYLEFLGNYNFAEAVKFYKKDKENREKEERKKRNGTGEIRIDKVMCLNHNGEKQQVFDTGDEITLYFHYNVIKEMEVNIHFCIYREDDMLCLGTSLWEDYEKRKKLTRDGSFEIKFPNLTLLPSCYRVEIKILTWNAEIIDEIEEACIFQVYSSTYEAGVCRIAHDWKFKEE